MLLNLTTTGRVTKDLELKQSQNGREYVSFGLAVNKGFGDKEKTIFLDCWLFEDAAKRIINAKVKKGSLITVSGELDTREYTKKDGTNGFSLNLNLYAWAYLPISKQDGDKSKDTPKDKSDIGNSDGFYPAEDLDGEDLPF